MIMNRILAVAAFSMAIGLSGAAFAAAQHGHGEHGAPATELKLDNGQKWRTDEPLRIGMSRIRAVLEASLPQIHEGRYSAAEFAALADTVQEQVDYVVANCRLPEEADLQLHVALTQVLDGVSAMKGEGGQQQGAATIAQALNAYGDHFDHPGWRPLTH